jgi:hypothetical protein
VKVFATFVLVLAGLVPTHADTQMWDITGNLVCFGFEKCDTPFNLTATMTTQTETGTFFFNYLGVPAQGTFPVETAISGTFNGDPISFQGPLFPAPGIDDFLMFADLPEGISFCTGAQCFGIFYDGDGVKIFGAGGSPFDTEYVSWGAADPVGTPEPSTLMLFTVPLLLALMRWAQMSLRKLSAH